jgi:hypothetical protein
MFRSWSGWGFIITPVRQRSLRFTIKKSKIFCDVRQGRLVGTDRRFGNKLSVPSSMIKQYWTLENGPIRIFPPVCRNLLVVKSQICFAPVSWIHAILTHRWLMSYIYTYNVIYIQLPLYRLSYPVHNYQYTDWATRPTITTIPTELPGPQLPLYRLSYRAHNYHYTDWATRPTITTIPTELPGQQLPLYRLSYQANNYHYTDW